MLVETKLGSGFLLCVALICLYAGKVNGGSVDFQLHFELGSAWDGNHTARAAMESMFGQYEAVMRTSGQWNSTIEVFVTDNENSAYASASPGSYGTVNFNGKEFSAPNAWEQIVQGADDPNGMIQPDGSGRDILVNWNLNLSQPQSNIGLLRHELMHGLGMISFLPRPSMAPGGEITRPVVGEERTVGIMDAALVDLNGAPLLAGYNGAVNRHVIADYAVDSDWGDANESGISFRGILDDGSTSDMSMNSWQATGTSNGGVDFAHITDVSYAYARNGDWNFVNAADRAFFRGLGYPTVSPTTRLADYNENTQVDGSDFLVWQRSVSLAGENSADGNGDLVVDGADLAIWEHDFGARDDHGHTAELATMLPAPGATGGVISSPGDADWFSFEAVAGTLYEIDSYSGSLLNPHLELYAADAVSPITFGASWQPMESGPYFLRVTNGAGADLGSYGLSVVEIPPDDHGDNASMVTATSVPGAIDGVIGLSDDQDWFSFEAESGEEYQLETTLGSLRDTVLTLYDTNGISQLAFNDDISTSTGNYASRIVWSASDTGTYYARVTSYQSQTGSYQFTINQMAGITNVPEPTSVCLVLLVSSLSVMSFRCR